MDQSERVLSSIDTLRTELHASTAETRKDMREGFQRVEDTLRGNHGRLAAHSERFKALDKKKRGEDSGGYPARRAHEEPSAKRPAWKKIAMQAACAVAGMVAVKITPPLLHLLAELLK